MKMQNFFLTIVLATLSSMPALAQIKTNRFIVFETKLENAPELTHTTHHFEMDPASGKGFLTIKVYEAYDPDPGGTSEECQVFRACGPRRNPLPVPDMDPIFVKKIHIPGFERDFRSVYYRLSPEKRVYCHVAKYLGDGTRNGAYPNSGPDCSIFGSIAPYGKHLEIKLLVYERRHHYW